MNYKYDLSAEFPSFNAHEMQQFEIQLIYAEIWRQIKSLLHWIDELINSSHPFYVNFMPNLLRIVNDL